jgi:hypothetical protein
MSLIGLLVLLGLAIALQPIPAISFIVVLNSKTRARGGLAFLVGWVGSLIIVVAVAVIINAIGGGSGFPQSSTSGKATNIALLLIGLALIAVGLRRLRKGTPPPSGPPKWLQHLRSLSLPIAMLLGALVQPWTLLIAGDLAILTADLRQRATVVAIALFCLFASAGILGMETFALAAPERAEVRLSILRGWIESHQGAVITWLAIIIGALLAIRGGANLL